jgi:hypothetical protein
LVHTLVQKVTSFLALSPHCISTISSPFYLYYLQTSSVYVFVSLCALNSILQYTRTSDWLRAWTTLGFKSLCSLILPSTQCIWLLTLHVVCYHIGKSACSLFQMCSALGCAETTQPKTWEAGQLRHPFCAKILPHGTISVNMPSC